MIKLAAVWLAAVVATALAAVAVAVRIDAILQLVQEAARKGPISRRRIVRRILLELVALVALSAALGVFGAWVWLGWTA
jgi:ABC-type enterochelin transport system permease subunit